MYKFLGLFLMTPLFAMFWTAFSTSGKRLSPQAKGAEFWANLILVLIVELFGIGFYLLFK